MNSSIVDKEDEDEIKRYFIDKDCRSTIIVVFEGDYVRFAPELKNGELGKKNNVT